MDKNAYLLDEIKKTKSLKEFKELTSLFFNSEVSYSYLIDYASIKNFDNFKDLNLLYTKIINHKYFTNTTLNSFVKFMVNDYCKFDANLFIEILLQKKDINLVKEFYLCCPKKMYNSQKIENLMLFL